MDMLHLVQGGVWDIRIICLSWTACSGDRGSACDEHAAAAAMKTIPTQVGVVTKGHKNAAVLQNAEDPDITKAVHAEMSGFWGPSASELGQVHFGSCP